MTRSISAWLLPLAIAVGLAIGADRILGAGEESKQDLKPAAVLPVTQVVLFNSGVGYFARSGELEGNARVDLSFPEADINDLLKSMILQDFGGGRVAAVQYDSREPAARTLASFAINLNQNPSLAQILHQARGERVEVALAPSAAAQPGLLSGTIVGLEKQKAPAANNATLDVNLLNLWCSDGLRAVKLADVQRLRFANPALEAELRRALDVLALNHDSAKKTVSLQFEGDRKRKVQVGYVVEAPIWKTSYRLVLDKEGKPYLQGWAAVENPTDEDWGNVKMALVSGRPISFKMDLYNPLYVPRPTVEPELFASLRPPAYRGGFRGEKEKSILKDLNEAEKQAKNLTNEDPGIDSNLDSAINVVRLDAQTVDSKVMDDPFGKGKTDRKSAAPQLAKITYLRRDGKFSIQYERELKKRPELASVASAATASSLGDFFQYVIDHPVILPRQKSALIPIAGKEVEAQRVSIYNPAVQARHPLLGLKFKNTSGLHLAQGPITVYEGNTYAGDTRVLDVQPNEERLVSYAIDLGTEIDPQAGPGSTRITGVKAQKGIVTTNRRIREEKKYRIVNRSQADRTVMIEHPNRTNQQFKLVETPKPIEDTPESYRFQMAVPAGKEIAFVVNEECDLGTEMALTNSNEDQIRYVISLEAASPALKAKLNEALTMKAAWDHHRRELDQVGLDLQRLSTDQDRIRKNLRETPKEAPVYETYLKKLSNQEKEIDGLTARQKELVGREFSAKKAYEDFLSGITE